MTPFVFYKHRAIERRRPERPPSFEIELFDSREPALAYGRKLLRGDALCTEIVVTENDAEVARLTRAGLIQ